MRDRFTTAQVITVALIGFAGGYMVATLGF